jgi:molybdopterin-guanine dinucleotide biosynthesis protein A
MLSTAEGLAGAGLVLAGGRSSRFGSDKAAARLNGLTLLEIAVRELQAGGRAVAVSAPDGSVAADLAASLGVPVLPDRASDAAGPLAGVRAGLVWSRRAGHRALAVRAVDTPWLPGDIHDRLAAALFAGAAPAAYCVTMDGPQPLCSVWTAAVLPRLEAALAQGRHPAVHRFLASIGAVSLSVEAEGFGNINTAEDLETIRTREAN